MKNKRRETKGSEDDSGYDNDGSKVGSRSEESGRN